MPLRDPLAIRCVSAGANNQGLKQLCSKLSPAWALLFSKSKDQSGELLMSCFGHLLTLLPGHQRFAQHCYDFRYDLVHHGWVWQQL